MMARAYPLVLVALAVLLAGCPAGMGPRAPFEAAQTQEQQAFALYGTFLVVKDQAARVAENPATPDAAVEAIARADLVVSPVFNALHDAAIAVLKARAEVESGAPAETLSSALAALAAKQREAGPSLATLSSAMVTR